jgi:hypothetical protein
VLSVSILHLIGKGKVIGINIEVRSHNRLTIEGHPLSHLIELIEGLPLIYNWRSNLFSLMELNATQISP